MIRERAYNGMPGMPVLFVFSLVDAGLLWMLVMNIRSESAPEIVFAAVGIAVTLFLTAGLFMVNPNEGKVLQLFGEYKGTAKIAGPALGESVPHQEEGVAARSQLRELASQGQRHRRQPDRNRGGRGVEGIRDRGSGVRSRRLRALRQGAERSGVAQSRHQLRLRRA